MAPKRSAPLPSPPTPLSYSFTSTAPNIAVIKYWGKRDESLILPINSSLSGSMNLVDLASNTLVLLVKESDQSRDQTGDSLVLNGKVDQVSKRMQRIFESIRPAPVDGSPVRFMVYSRNNFPTAAGLASSAAGLAALAVSCTRAVEKLEAQLALPNARTFTPEQVSGYARAGSGSACRSVFGGWVAWDMGTKEDGSDSLGRCVAPASHWPEMKVLIAVVSDAQKDTPSTSGMSESVKTSRLLAHRASAIVPERMEAMERAILARDFTTFANLTMADSNQFHATCLDTFPPIFYLNDTSRRIIQLVHEYNRVAGEVRVAYTFDAGPNAVLYVLDKYQAEVEALLFRLVPPTDTKQSQEAKAAAASPTVKGVWPTAEPRRNGVSRLIRTSIGGAPENRDDEPVEKLLEELL